MVWIFYGNNADNRLMCCSFSCCSAVLAPSQGLLSVPCSASQQVHKKLAGSTTRTAGPKWPQGYSIPWNVRLSKPAGRIGQGADLCSGTAWASSRWWAVHCASLFLWGFTSLSFLLQLLLLLLYYTLYQLWNCSYLKPRSLLFFFSFSSPSHRRVSKCPMWYLIARWG